MSENAVSAAMKAGQKAQGHLQDHHRPARRRVGVAVLVGLIAGIFSGIIKFGWGSSLPAPHPERNSTNPPQAPLEQIFGMSPETSHATYSYLGNDLPYMSFIIHPPSRFHSRSSTAWSPSTGPDQSSGRVPHSVSSCTSSST